MTVPGSGGNSSKSWDPAVAVDPRNGTVYVSFMFSKGAQYYPVVAASFDHGLQGVEIAHVGRPHIGYAVAGLR